jgi:hypothetical protein
VLDPLAHLDQDGSTAVVTPSREDKSVVQRESFISGGVGGKRWMSLGVPVVGYLCLEEGRVLLSTTAVEGCVLRNDRRRCCCDRGSQEEGRG